MAYQNGRLPGDALRRIDGSGGAERLEQGALESFESAAAELRERCGKRLASFVSRIDFGAAYRSYDQQVFAKQRDPSSAAPGTSNHGWGIAVDLGNGGAFDPDVIAVMAAHGWVRDAVTATYPSGEPWHWHFLGTDPVVEAQLAALAALLLEENDMKLLRQGEDSDGQPRGFLLGPIGGGRLGPNRFRTLVRSGIWGDPVEVSREQRQAAFRTVLEMVKDSRLATTSNIDRLLAAAEDDEPDYGEDDLQAF